MAQPRLVSAYLALALMLSSNQNNCKADVDSGCPSWGCLPWGSFSLSAGIPSFNSTVSWQVHMETVSSNDDNGRVPRGCVSDQETVVCTTSKGYISVDPTNGKTLWSYSTRASPYLPIMDIYSDVIGMDSEAMYYVGGDGKPKHPIPLGIFKPSYSLMISNNSIMFITGSTNKTAQILTYDTDGIVDGAIPLKDSINSVNGTFVPCSQPIIAGFRAYVMTYFIPDSDSKNAQRVNGSLRLYAIDVLHQLAPRIVIAWHFDLNSVKRQFGKHPAGASTTKHKGKYIERNELDPIVTYFSGVVYVNVPGNWERFNKHKRSEVQPYEGELWAVRDSGDKGTLQFRTQSLYGHMAVYDTYDNPLSKSKIKTRQGRPDTSDEEEHLLWIVNQSPAIIQGYDTRNGTIKTVNGFGNIFDKIGHLVTSGLSITRSTQSPNNDQLVFGTSDTIGRAFISVVEIDGSMAELILSRIVSRTDAFPAKEDDGQTTAMVEGQIVNFAFYPPGTKKGGKGKTDGAGDTWTLGLAAVVMETNSTSVSRTVVGIF